MSDLLKTRSHYWSALTVHLNTNFNQHLIQKVKCILGFNVGIHHDRSTSRIRTKPSPGRSGPSASNNVEKCADSGVKKSVAFASRMQDKSIRYFSKLDGSETEENHLAKPSYHCHFDGVHCRKQGWALRDKRTQPWAASGANDRLLVSPVVNARSDVLASSRAPTALLAGCGVFSSTSLLRLLDRNQRRR